MVSSKSVGGTERLGGKNKDCLLIHPPFSWIRISSGKKETSTKVQSARDALDIKVDNLCSFLPQDKVADFARVSLKIFILPFPIEKTGQTKGSEADFRCLFLGLTLS